MLMYVYTYVLKFDLKDDDYIEKRIGTLFRCRLFEMSLESIGLLDRNSRNACSSVHG